MIVLTNSAAVTLTTGQSMTFDTVVLKSGCGECYRNGTGSIKMKYNGIYEAKFDGNVTGATAATPVTLALQLGGDTLKETTMIYTPAAENAVGNVGCQTAIRNCCGDYDRVTVTNIGTEAATISANAMLMVKRVA